MILECDSCHDPADKYCGHCSRRMTLDEIVPSKEEFLEDEK
jgi:hypothetical protein